ncbi:MAG: hypothetical protein KC910_03800 [Candidatus Eremiobacteraeota bacterium]|nr:hypothetical protein [Candidatus Eremiobacteraeota bacterium]
MGRRGARGLTIGSVLLLVTIITLALFTVVAVSFFHLNFSNTVVDQREARNLAESAVATALGKIWMDQTYGKARSDDQTIHIPSSYAPTEAEGWLTFSTSKASSLKLPYSTNNFEEPTSVAGANGRQIPDSAVHLVAVGKCKNARYQMEAIYYIPPYPNALASTGPLTSSGGLLVAGVSSTQAFADSGKAAAIDPADLDMAHVASNYEGDTAVQIGPTSTVMGDVMAVGGIDLDSTVKVAGEVREHSGKQTMPDLDVDNIFAKLDEIKGNDQILDGAPTMTNLEVDFFTEALGDLKVNGNIHLNGGLLYVRGDVDVSGKVYGNGAIFSLGDVSIKEGAEISATDVVALVSKGDITLHGLSKAGNFFNGLVYTEGDLWAKDITVVGAAVANGPKGKGKLRLDNVTLVKTPISVSFAVGIPDVTKSTLPSMATTSDGDESDFYWAGFGHEDTVTSNIISAADQAKLNNSVVAGLAVSGHRMPATETGDERFSIAIQGAFSRGSTYVDASAIPAEDAANMMLDKYPFVVDDKVVYVNYYRGNNVTRDEILAQVNDWAAVAQASAGEPVEYTVTTEHKTKKKSWFGISSKTTKTYTSTTATFQPAVQIDDMKVDAYLTSLLKPTVKNGKEFFMVNLDLNQVFDPAEKSRVLLWQQF